MTKVNHTPPDLAGRERFAPSYGVMLQMCGQLIAESIGEDGAVLVVGAGGGLELEALARRASRWKFCAIDPASNMLEQAREKARACGAFDRTVWVDGYVTHAPKVKYDAATCLLTLHFVPESEKLGTLIGIRSRLKPGAPFLLVDLCMDKQAANYERNLSRYAQFALDCGASPAEVDTVRERLRNVLQTVSDRRNVALLAEAGFGSAEIFYAAHAWRGWVAYA